MLATEMIETTMQFSLYLLNTAFQVLLLLFVLLLSAALFVQYRTQTRLLLKLSDLRLHFLAVLGHLHISLRNRVGSLHTYHVYDFQAMCAYTRLCSQDSLTPIWLLAEPFVLLYKADSVKVILNHGVELKKSWFYSILIPWLGTGLLTSDGAKWKQRRKMLTPSFHFDVLRNFLPGINSQSKVLVSVLNKTVNDEWIDFAPYMIRCSLDIICETIMGKKVNCQVEKDSKYVRAVAEIAEDSFHRMMSPWLWPSWLFYLLPTGRRARKSLNVVHEFTRKVIADRKKEILESGFTTGNENEDNEVYRGHKKRAFLDFLLEEHLKNKSLSEEDIREEVDTFTFEGHDTTALGMTWACYLIGRYPDVQKKVHEELDMIFGDDKERDVTAEDLKDLRYLELVLKESQRLYPSVPFFGRKLIGDVQFKGRVIPKGTNCTILTYMLHRDPDVFPNPEVFDPDRFLPENCRGRDAFAYIPFSAGPRNCIGQKFAMMEEKIVLATLLRNFEVYSLDPRDQVQVVADLILRPCYPIRIRIRPRMTVM